MSALPFLLSLLALAGGTYALRILGVTLGSRLAGREQRPDQQHRQQAPAAAAPAPPGAPAAAPGDGNAASAPEPLPLPAASTPARRWMDRATVVLVCAVAATTMVFEGQDFAGPSRLLGALSGMVAALCKAPLLACVVVGMAVCALLRLAGVG